MFDADMSQSTGEMPGGGGGRGKRGEQHTLNRRSSAQGPQNSRKAAALGLSAGGPTSTTLKASAVSSCTHHTALVANARGHLASCLTAPGFCQFKAPVPQRVMLSGSEA